MEDRSKQVAAIYKAHLRPEEECVGSEQLLDAVHLVAALADGPMIRSAAQGIMLLSDYDGLEDRSRDLEAE